MATGDAGRKRKPVTASSDVMTRVAVALVLALIFGGAFWWAHDYAPEAMRNTLLVIVVALAFVSAAIFAAMHLGRHEHISLGAHIVQAFVMSTAFALGGYFYFVEGRGHPHADVTQVINSARLPDGNIVVEATISVKNLGTEPLHLTSLDSSLAAVDLNRAGLEGIAEKKEPYWNASVDGQVAFPQIVDKKVVPGPELAWPIQRAFDGRIDHQIEAGETDPITVTFLIPCRNYRYARVASEVTKEADRAGGKMVWKAPPSFVDLQSDSLCSKGK